MMAASDVTAAMAEEPTPPRVSRIRVVVSIFFLAALVVFALLHVGEARRFARLVERAEPLWLLAAAAF